MSFVEQADSWRSKAHLSGPRMPALLGVIVLILAIALFAGYQLFTAAANETLVIEQALNDSEDKTSDSAESVTVNDAVSPVTDNSNNSDDSASSSVESPTSTEIAPTTTQSTYFVHVGGCVVTPGVVEIPSTSRVSDAIAAAGGFSENAAPDALNLARPVTDGERIIVPSFEEYEADRTSFASPTPDVADLGTTSDNGGSAAASSTGGPININTASAAELQTLNGIGPSTAEKIVADREALGPFNSIEDLMRVSGIGEKKFAAIANSICTG